MTAGFEKIRMACGLLAVSSTLNASHIAPPSHRAEPPILMIRVSQESSPGAGDFDTHVLGFVRALNTNQKAADFYQYGRIAANYGNTEPVLNANTSHIFFVNAGDGLSLFAVHNNSNHAENGRGGTAETKWDLSGGTASILLSDEETETVVSDGGTVFTGDYNWAQSNTDGAVIGALPVRFTLLGQFTTAPTGLAGGWEVISADGSKIPLSLVVGQRVRLDVALHVQVRQDH